MKGVLNGHEGEAAAEPHEPGARDVQIALRSHRDVLAAGNPARQAELEQVARPLVMRFEEIWATGQPGLSATVLGL